MMANLKRFSIRGMYFGLLLLTLVTIGQGIIRYKLAPDGLAVYDLTWSGPDANDSVIYHKWRYFLKTDTCLPSRIEKYSKTTADTNAPYRLTETLVIEYPADDQISQAVNTHFLSNW